MNRCGRSLHVLVWIGLAGGAALAHAQDRAPVAGLGQPVPPQSLAMVRGGFDLGNGLEVSFGIQRAIYVDGNLVTYINVTIPDIAHITTQQAVSLAQALGTIDIQVGAGNTFAPAYASPSGAASLAQTVTQNVTQDVTQSLSQAPSSGATAQANAGAGALQAPTNTAAGVPVVTTIVPASATQASAATIIQNSVNNQLIRSLTTLNVTVNALNAMRGQGLQQSLQAAQQLQAILH